MIQHIRISDARLHMLIKSRLINYGGNKQLRIYGTLHCKSGKWMKRENRVFFYSQEEAIELGYRPCGHCMRREYNAWKSNY